MTRAEILAELEKTRWAVSQNTALLRRDLDVGTQIRSSIARHAYGWIAGALLVGVYLSRRGSGPAPKPIKPKKGEKTVSIEEPIKKATTLSLLIAGFRIAMPFIKPIFTAYASKGLTQFASRLGK
ncbi:MAG: hypothetical protein ABIP97_04480 [Chthoniobacterales bacterium]